MNTLNSSLKFSIEFFPPKTPEGAEKLQRVRERLSLLKPEYFSVTFGAGGATQQGTLDTVLSIQKAGQKAVPHLSCIGSTRASISQILDLYQTQGIHHIVALRGDLPSGYGAAGEFRYANELIEFIRDKTGDYFHIEVAAYPEVHPQALSSQSDLQYFVRKVKAGANAAITQYFYNADAYFDFVNSVQRENIAIPIVPGIMPITQFTQLKRFSELCGAEIPRWMMLKLMSYGDDQASIRAFGLEVVTRLCERLLQGGAPALHFYSLNQADAVEQIVKNFSKNHDSAARSSPDLIVE